MTETTGSRPLVTGSPTMPAIQLHAQRLLDVPSRRAPADGDCLDWQQLPIQVLAISLALTERARMRAAGSVFGDRKQSTAGDGEANELD